MAEQLVFALSIFLIILPIIFFFKEKDKNLSKYLVLISSYHILYVALLFLPISYPFLSLSESTLNWTGKFLTLIFSTIFYFTCRKHFTKFDYVLAMPSKGSLKKIILVGSITLITMCALTIFFSKGKSLDIERLGYQLTMPGLDEELWRGIIIGTLLMVLKEKYYKSGHPAIWITTIIFGLNHSLYFQNWELGFALDAFIVTGTLGYILGWMIYRSKSILPAIIFHNLINFSTNFLEMVVI